MAQKDEVPSGIRESESCLAKDRYRDSLRGIAFILLARLDTSPYSTVHTLLPGIDALLENFTMEPLHHP
jgi:hypothetical protein